MSEADGKIRIQKYLSTMGVGSRRAIEQMILDGRISVNGKLIADVPCFVVPEVDEIRVDFRLVARRAPERLYFLLNKPRGVVCTQSDPQGRPRAIDMLPPSRSRVYCVGRLDAESTGLLLLTNDGALTQHLTHPKYEVPKTYVVQMDGELSAEDFQKLKKGIWLDGSRTQPARVRVLRRSRKQTQVQIRLTEGRNREIRRLLARLGHKVRRLKRTAIGPLSDRGLKLGHFRALKPPEIAKLKRLTLQ